MLVELAESDDAWLRDLRAASTRCLALLSTADALKPRLADAGVLPLLCHAGARAPREESFMSSRTQLHRDSAWTHQVSALAAQKKMRPMHTTGLTLLLR